MDNERGRKVSVDPELAKDPNYVAWKVQEEELKANYMGEWVAFAGGQLVLTEKDKETLFKKINEGFTDQSVFIKEIVAVERVIHMRSPRLVRD